MIKRKLQFQNGSFFSTIPKDFVETLGLKAGDKIDLSTDGRQIVIVPVTAAKQEPAQASTLSKEVPAQ